MAKKVFLGVGHGGTDSGAVANNLKEKDLNLAIALACRDELKRHSVEVGMSRTKDENDPLADEIKECNKFNPDVAVEIHNNAGGGDGVEIFHTYKGGKGKTLANNILKEIVAVGQNSRGLKTKKNSAGKDYYGWIRETSCPACLIECAFVDNKKDIAIIDTAAEQKKMGIAIAKGVLKTLGIAWKAEVVKTTTTTVGSTYKLVTEVNRYASAADAQAKANSNGKYDAGTYYIFNKYPNGLNGMYNISTDKTGASAGSWINPSENKIEEQIQKLYRVRKTWADTKSQIGAYSSLDNAKDACQKAGTGYKVFDWNGKEVYSYVALTIENKPVQSTQPETPVTTEPKKVYELEFPVKHKICEYKTMEENDYKKYFTQCCEIILKNNSVFDTNIVKAFFTLAPIYGIDPIRAISQSILETGWFKYQGSAVKPEHHNYCGLGVTTTGKPGNIFNSVEYGVRAQLQHLFAYGSKDNLPTGETLLDQRFKYVTRGIALTWEELAGRWAVPGFDGNDPQAAIDNGTTYGQKIDKIYQSIIESSISDEDIKKYFDVITPQEPTDIKITPKPEVEPNQPKQEDKKEVDTDKVNSILDILIKILNFIVNFFKKK